MDISKFNNHFTRFASRQVLQVQKHSPVILFTSGVVGIVGTVVLASKATLHVEEILESTDSDLKRANDGRAKSLAGKLVNEYTDEQYKRDVLLIKTKNVINIGRLYAPAFFLGVASIAALTGSHIILSKRNVALTAAYKVVEKKYNDYKERVENELGEERANEILNGRTYEVENPKTGKTEKQVVHEPLGSSPYARLFSEEETKMWSPQADYNYNTLRLIQAWCNDKLKSQGHLFLNEVFDHLGMKRTKAGAHVGWVWTPNNPGPSDNFVDFNVYGTRDGDGLNYINGFEPTILLDFNVDGIILDRI